MKQWCNDRSFDVRGRLDGKSGCAFSSFGAWGGGAEHACQALTKLWTDYGLPVYGITDYVAPKMAPHCGAIDAGELRSAAEKTMCRRFAEWCSVYVDGAPQPHPIRAEFHRPVQNDTGLRYALRGCAGFVGNGQTGCSTV